MRDRSLYAHFPSSPGVYCMKNIRGEILYIGKATNLFRRVSSYFLRAHDSRIQKLVSEIHSIDYQETDSALEALILEAELIKREQPPYNIREKDDKSFLFIEITKEKFPRVLLVRGKLSLGGERFGPFPSSSSVREALLILRKIFPWSVHSSEEIGKAIKPCFDYQIGLCPGTCIGRAEKKVYQENIRHLRLFLHGKKKMVLRTIEKRMQAASDVLDYEGAVRYRKQLFALQHIHDALLIRRDDYTFSGSLPKHAYRIEGYDISNTAGTDAVGSLVVFLGDTPQKSEYKKFIIRSVVGPNDVGMLREVLTRRLQHAWPIPDLIFVDGGLPQVHAVENTLAEFGIALPVIGIAKGPTRKKVEIIGAMPSWVREETLLRVRDEAHRFAISFHRVRRSGRMKL